MGTHKGTLSKQMTNAEARERERKALELRKAGMTYQMIADSLGYSGAGGAHRVVKRALDAIADEPAEDLRKLMDERLDTLLMHTWPGAQNGDPQSINQALRIMDRQAQLRGLDAPREFTVNARTEHVLEIGGDKETFIEALRAYRDRNTAQPALVTDSMGGGMVEEAEVVDDDGQD